MGVGQLSDALAHATAAVESCGADAEVPLFTPWVRCLWAHDLEGHRARAGDRRNFGCCHLCLVHLVISLRLSQRLAAAQLGVEIALESPSRCGHVRSAWPHQPIWAFRPEIF
eukprot:Skav225755  [mRNA]  locus=scaffold6265:8495:12005:+ [translate_table: standard]